jgi:hypothetical protein
LFDEPLPPGTEVHTLKKQEWRDEAGYSPRLLKVTRTDGSCWLCRTTVQELPRTPITDIVAAMPDGAHFCTGHFIVSRDDPQSHEAVWVNEIKWSDRRDLVFFFFWGNRLAAFGSAGRLWEFYLPGADPEAFILFDFVGKDGSLYCTARQEERDEDGNITYSAYAIDRTGTIRQSPPRADE